MLHYAREPTSNIGIDGEIVSGLRRLNFQWYWITKLPIYARKTAPKLKQTDVVADGTDPLKETRRGEVEEL